MAPERHMTRGERRPTVVHHPGGTTWVVLPLDDEWDSYVRVQPRGGHPVVAELRVLPAWLPWQGSYGMLALAFDDDYQQPAVDDDSPRIEFDIADPPEGGLTSRALRRVHLGRALELAYEALRDTSFAEGAGFSRTAVSAPRRPGRKGRDDRFYATIAAAYVDALKAGSRKPVEDAAQALSDGSGGTYEATYVRDLLHAARRRGLLSRPPKGRAGGKLTEKALKALRDNPEGD